MEDHTRLTQHETLLNLLGKTVKYNGVKYKIERFKDNGHTTVIYTDRRTFNFMDAEFVEFVNALNYVNTKVSTFKPSALPETNTKPETISLQLYEATDSQKKLTSTLLDMLDKVSTDSAYIAQAKSVCDIANTMVNIEKTQIDLMRLAQKRK